MLSVKPITIKTVPLHVYEWKKSKSVILKAMLVIGYYFLFEYWLVRQSFCLLPCLVLWCTIEDLLHTQVRFHCWAYSVLLICLSSVGHLGYTQASHQISVDCDCKYSIACMYTPIIEKSRLLLTNKSKSNQEGLK